MNTPQAIETAPRDGSMILGYDDGWLPMAWSGKRWELEGCVWPDESYYANPTHWLPYPADPTA